MPVLLLAGGRTTPSARGVTRLLAATLPRVYVGQVGVVVSELRPGGVCEFSGSGGGGAAAAPGERIEARAEQGVIPAGRRVEVVAVVDHRPLVRAVT